MPRVNATFNGITRIIEIAEGVSTVDVLELFSDAKDLWQGEPGTYTKFPFPFNSSGGDPSVGGIRGQYADIDNGWQIKINGSVSFVGNLFRFAQDPFGSSRSVIREEVGVKLANILASNLSSTQEINTGSGLSTQQATQLSDVAATLATPGVFSTDALANAPSGSGATPQQIWEYATRTLTALPATAALEASVQAALTAIAALDGDATATNQAAILSAIAQLQAITAELHTFRGLNAAKPISRDKTGNTTTESDGTVTLTHTANPSNETVSTQRSG